MRRVVIAAALIAGCGHAVERDPVKRDDKSQCATEANGIVAFLRAANTEPGTYSGEVTLVLRKDLTARPDIERRAVWLNVLHGEYSVYKHVTADGLSSALKEQQDQRGTARIYLLIDVNATWGDVVTAVKIAAAEGFTKPTFMFHTEVPVTPPPRSKVDDRLDAIMKKDPTNIAMDLAQLMSDVIESCPPMKKAFSSIAAVDGDDKAAILITSIGEALPACKCSLDTAALRSVMWRIISNPTPPRAIAFDGSAPTKTIALPSTMLWSDASKQLTPDVKSAKLDVAP